MKNFLKIASVILSILSAWILIPFLLLFVYYPFAVWIISKTDELVDLFIFYPLIPFLNLVLWWLSGKYEDSLAWKKFNKILGITGLVILVYELFILFESLGSVRY